MNNEMNVTHMIENTLTWGSLPCCFTFLEPEETSKQNEEAQDKPLPGTEGAAQWSETKGGACGTSADEIPGKGMRL